MAWHIESVVLLLGEITKVVRQLLQANGAFTSRIPKESGPVTAKDTQAEMDALAMVPFHEHSPV